MRQASGISERPPFRPEAWIGCGFHGICYECGERVEPHHEVMLGYDGDPLVHAECAEGEGYEAR